MSAAPPYVSVLPVAERRRGDDWADVGSTFSAWLHRPYLDLGPLVDGPLHAWSIPFAFEQLVTGSAPIMPLQHHPSIFLRSALARSLRSDHFAVRRASDLPPAFRTDEWTLVVDLVDRFSDLAFDTQVRLVQLLETMALYVDSDECLRVACGRESWNTQFLESRRTFSALKRSPSDRTRREDKIALARLATDARSMPAEALAAASTLIVLSARGPERDAEAVRRWRSVGEKLLPDLSPEDSLLDALRVSAFWRAASYLPFLAGDADATSAELDEAERWANAFDARSPQEQLLLRQNLHPLLETRMKEAKAFGHCDVAVARGRKLVALDPFDGKVYLRLGDALLDSGATNDALDVYMAGADLGAPFAAANWLMAAVCQEVLGSTRDALMAFTWAVEADPGLASAAEGLLKLAASARDLERVRLARSLLRWVRNELRSRPRVGNHVSTCDRVTRQPKERRPSGSKPRIRQLTNANGDQLAWPTRARDSGALSAHLLAPYLDLGGPGGPNHAVATRMLGDLLDDDGPLPPLQRNTSTHLRPSLMWELGLASYAVDDPRQMPPELRTPRWSVLCERLDGWGRLEPEERLRVAMLLNRLGLYSMTVSLPPTDESATSEAFSERAILEAVAMYKLGAYQSARTRLEAVACDERAPTEARFAAILNLVVHHGKISSNGGELARWIELSRQLQPVAESAVPGHSLIATSMSARAESFAPYHAGDSEGVRRLLDQAEQLALEAQTELGVDDAFACENLFAVWETRLNEARWIRDRTAAVERARLLVSLDPLDGKAYLLLGEAQRERGDVEEARESFAHGASLGAPHAARAWFEHGICDEHLGEPDAAVRAFRRSLDADPYSVSALARLRPSPRLAHARAIGGWRASRIESLRSLARDAMPAASGREV
jgi:tetratricopeptide (TPR) repeat protein